MMPDLKLLNELLSAATGILDRASSEVRDVPLEPKNENISKIAQALTLIFDIQYQIYEIDPKLEPAHLKRPSPFPPGVSRRFGEILLEASDLCHEKKYQEAISLYESYISENPPDFFVELAEGQIHKIKKDYGA